MKQMIVNEYRHNRKFREYVDRYSQQRKISVDEQYYLEHFEEIMVQKRREVMA